MVGMRVVAGPEEFVLANYLHHRGDRSLIGIGRDVTLALEIVGRTLLQSDGRAERGAVEDGVATIEEITDPSGLRFEHDGAQFRKAIEYAELKERAEGVLHSLAGEQIEIPGRP